MDTAAFLLRILGASEPGEAIADPLAASLARIGADSETGEGRMFLRVCAAIASTEGEFRPEELAALGADAMQLLRALADARMTGRYSVADWARIA